LEGLWRNFTIRLKERGVYKNLLSLLERQKKAKKPGTPKGVVYSATKKR